MVRYTPLMVLFLGTYVRHHGCMAVHLLPARNRSWYIISSCEALCAVVFPLLQNLPSDAAFPCLLLGLSISNISTDFLAHDIDIFEK